VPAKKFVAEAAAVSGSMSYIKRRSGLFTVKNLISLLDLLDQRNQIPIVDVDIDGGESKAELLVDVIFDRESNCVHFFTP